MDRERLKRSGQVLAPNLFTLANMAFGFFALLAAHWGDFTAAAGCILGGLVCDMLDGRIARLLHGESTFGVEFDSLSDFLTFGAAPAFMMYALLLKDYGIFGALAALLYATGGALRLARFNAFAQAGKGSKTHFTGLPIPAAAGLLASFVLLYQIVEQGKPANTMDFLMRQIPSLAGVGPFLTIALGLLMVSTIPYGAFKGANPVLPRNAKFLAGAGAVAGLIYLYPQNTIFLLFLFYVLSGFTGWLIGRRPPPAPKD